MTLKEYERLFELLVMMGIEDCPEHVRRHTQGLLKALGRWRQSQPAISTEQARFGPRRSDDSADASLETPGETSHGENPRTRRADFHR
jgi:hypothetical protein